MVVALLLAAALAHPTTAANRISAHVEAAALLQRVVLPARSRRLAGAPGDAGGLLSRPWQTSVYANVVDRARFWRVDAPLDAVAAFLRAHRPRGSRFDSGELSPEPRGLLFDLPRTRSLYQRRLALTLAPLPDGSTGVRVDAEVVWTVERPPSEVVPGGVRQIDLTTPASARRIVEPAKVRTIVRWLDALPVDQPTRGIFGCPAVLGPNLHLVFRDADGRVLARASVAANRGYSSFCNAISFAVAGRAEQPLLGGWFVRRVERLTNFHPRG